LVERRRLAADRAPLRTLTGGSPTPRRGSFR
jgi:hypothetical protein